MSSTNVVADITSVGMLPAFRPADHVQRIFAGLFFGAFAGSLIGILFFSYGMAPFGYILPFIVAAALLVIGLTLYYLVRDTTDHSIPVVAKVLGTAEHVSNRRLKSGGIAVPVVVHPLEGENFRTIVVANAKRGEPGDIPVGTLLALRQIEPGVGDLYPAEATEEQREYMRRWADNPRLVKNRAKALPLRRSPLDRRPLLAGIELYGAVLVSAIAMILALSAL
ncbi:MAG: hypothetical protein Q4P33_05725 [Flaviflexus sp.]|nr:hypothetical protein [Flaviflexus sp.]